MKKGSKSVISKKNKHFKAGIVRLFGDALASTRFSMFLHVSQPQKWGFGALSAVEDIVFFWGLNQNLLGIEDIFLGHQNLPLGSWNQALVG